MNESNVSVEDYDLGEHAVVEASAGTGKTYTIERLVLRLLIDEAVPLDKILVVTFTEKATGDLKNRLRRMLVRGLQNATDPVPLVQSALDQFDQAPIFTIHGFCQRLLQEYALEQGQDFAPSSSMTLICSRRCCMRSSVSTGALTSAISSRPCSKKRGTTAPTAEDWDGRVLDIAKSLQAAVRASVTARLRGRLVETPG